MSEPDCVEGLGRRVWLHILRGGGRWRLIDVADELDAPRDRVNKHAMRMAERGFLIRYEPMGGALLTYGVTRSCKVPLGVTLKDLEAGNDNNRSAA